MSTLLASLGIPTYKGYAPEHVPADADRVIVGNAALAGQPRGGGGGAARHSDGLDAPGHPRVPPSGKDVRRHHGHAREDDDFGSRRVAALRHRPGSGLSRRGRDPELRARLPARRRARTSCSRATNTTPRSSTAGRNFSTTSPGISSSGTSSTTTRTCIPTSSPSRRRSGRSRRSCRQAASWHNADDPRVVDVVGRSGTRAPRRRGSRSKTSPRTSPPATSRAPPTARRSR